MSLNQQIDAHKIHSGWLYKKGWYNTSWRKRYFVLYDDRTIHYFTKECHASNRSKAKGKIHLTQIRRVELVQYKDPKNKTKTNNSANSSMLYRKSSLPIHLSYSSHSTHSSLTSTAGSVDHGHGHKKRGHQRQTQSHTHIISSYSFNNNNNNNNTKKTNISSTSKSKTKQKTKSKSKSPKDLNTFNFNKTTSSKLDRTSSHKITNNNNNRPSSIKISKSFDDKSYDTMSPLQSIDEKESVEAVQSLQPYTVKHNHFSSAPSALNGVNGWSFDESMGIDNFYYSQPSNIVSSSQPPPDYNEIIENEKKFEKEREELEKSLKTLTQNTYGDGHILKSKNKQKDQKKRKKKQQNKVKYIDNEEIEDKNNENDNDNNIKPISATSAEYEDSITPNFKPQAYSKSPSSHSHIQPLTLQSSSTMTIQSNNNNNNNNNNDNLLIPPQHKWSSGSGSSCNGTKSRSSYSSTNNDNKSNDIGLNEFDYDREHALNIMNENQINCKNEAIRDRKRSFLMMNESNIFKNGPQRKRQKRNNYRKNELDINNNDEYKSIYNHLVKLPSICNIHVPDDIIQEISQFAAGHAVQCHNTECQLLIYQKTDVFDSYYNERLKQYVYFCDECISHGDIIMYCRETTATSKKISNCDAIMLKNELKKCESCGGAIEQCPNRCYWSLLNVSSCNECNITLCTQCALAGCTMCNKSSLCIDCSCKLIECDHCDIQCCTDCVKKDPLFKNCANEDCQRYICSRCHDPNYQCPHCQAKLYFCSGYHVTIKGRCNCNVNDMQYWND